MIKTKCLTLLAVLALVSFPAVAASRAHRSAAEIKLFKLLNPCPTTGARLGSCPGYIIDHIIPLCAGGPDRRTNMQWQTRADSLKKDKLERRQCAALRKAAAK